MENDNTSGDYMEIVMDKVKTDGVAQVEGNIEHDIIPEIQKGSMKKSKIKGKDTMLRNVKDNLVINGLGQNGNGEATTRSSAKAVLKWSALNVILSKECRAAACTAEIVQGSDPMPSPFAPTAAGQADPPLYLKVTWQSIAHLFSYYMAGTEENVKKFLGKTNSNRDEMEEEEDTVEVADIAEAKKGIAEEDLENGEEELEITSNRNEWPAMPKFTKGKIVYIPIAFLHALSGTQVHPWLELESMRGAPRGGLRLENEPFKFAKNVKLFTKKDISGPNPRFKRQDRPLWVALRDGNGHLIFCLHDSSWTWDFYQAANRLKIAWRAALGAIIPPSKASGGKPPRYQAVPVGELKIKITALGEARWKKRGGAQALFETFIAEINKNEEANYGTVSLYTGDGVPEDHRLLSEDPFGLYRTYISFEGYNSYMNFLLLGAVPENREVETYIPRREIIDTSAVPENKEVETYSPGWEIIDTRALPTRLGKPLKLKNTKEEKEKEKEEILERKKEENPKIRNGDQDQKNKISPLTRARINQNKMKAGDKNDTNESRRNGRNVIEKGNIQARIHKTSSEDIRTLTVVNVNAQKIALAKGQRKNETKDQGAVMAASAPDTARKLLNWQWIDPKVRMMNRVKRESAYHTNEMFNGLYIAEWLHLSAYSWGGLADPEPNATVGEAGSSQIYPNLVLGTSETNSVMTRCETAWQNLIEHEGDLLTAAGGHGKAYGGQLTIVRHPFSKINLGEYISEADQKKKVSGIRRKESFFDTDKMTKSFGPQGDSDKPLVKIPANTGTKLYAPFLHDVRYVPATDNSNAPATDNPKAIQWAPKSTVLDETLQRAAQEFRWICYQFDYDLHITANSKILQRKGFKGRTRFYPFRRMLYHKIERDLDAKVWKDMLNEALKEVPEQDDPKA